MITGERPRIVKKDNFADILLEGFYKDRLFQISVPEFERQLNLRPVVCAVHHSEPPHANTSKAWACFCGALCT